MIRKSPRASGAGWKTSGIVSLSLLNKGLYVKVCHTVVISTEKQKHNVLILILYFYILYP